MADVMSAVNDYSEPPVNGSAHLHGYLQGNVTTDASDDAGGVTLLLPIEFVVVLVLAAACVLVGVVYAYFHITRAARARVEKHKRRPSMAVSHHGHHISSVDEGSRQQTHLMFFRRTTTYWHRYVSTVFALAGVYRLEIQVHVQADIQ